jgi:hypothetical protein
MSNAVTWAPAAEAAVVISLVEVNVAGASTRRTMEYPGLGVDICMTFLSDRAEPSLHFSIRIVEKSFHLLNRRCSLERKTRPV